MRLFAKIFLCATFVISIALLLAGYLLITFSHENVLKRELDYAITQYQFDRFTAQAGLISYADDLREGASQAVFNRISLDMVGRAAFFSEDKSLLYSDFPLQSSYTAVTDVPNDSLVRNVLTVDEEGSIQLPDDMPDNSLVHQYLTVEDASYVTVCGRLAQGGAMYYLAVAYDISSVAAQKEQMTQSFAWVYFVTLLFGMTAILILSVIITRPINKVTRAANEIAQGRYDERLPVSTGDEIGELSSSFNKMAGAVEDKIEEVSNAARQKEDFVANFAHELKTPLTSVIGYADMLYQKNLPPELAKEAAWYILSEGLRLESLSLKLLELIVLNRRDFVLEEMRADELLTSIACGMKPILEERRVALHVDAAPAYVMVEYDLFKTLVLNLLDNAIKAGCTRIDITGNPIMFRYYISIVDNGRGVPEQDIDRVGEAFYMVDKSRSRKQHGAGLGLSLATKVADIHGSKLEFSSKEGIGTVVEVDLRLGKGELKNASESPQCREAEASDD